MKNIVFSKEKGFTLIELLVVTAIIGVLGVVSATIFNSILRSQNKTSIINEVRQNANIVISKFERDVKQAAQITWISDYEIELETHDGVTITWECNTGVGGSRVIFRNGAAIINTDPINGVQADSCLFTPFPAGSTSPRLIQFSFHLTQGSSAPDTPEFKVDVPFTITVGIR